MRETRSWRRATPVFCGLMLLATLAVLAATVAQPPPAAQRARAKQLVTAGNFRDALAIYTRLAHARNTETTQVGEDLRQAIYCLTRLGQPPKIDALRDKAVDVHGKNWRLLQAAAQTLLAGPHYGVVIAGEYQRGGRGRGSRYVNSSERDRAQALGLMERALPLVAEDPNPRDRGGFYLEFARTVMTGRSPGNTWRLTGLTDTAELPELDTGGYGFGFSRFGGTPRGAPVDAEGNAVFHQLPDSYAAAKTDGQRWRWALSTAIAADPRRQSEATLRRTRFLRAEFGVQTMRYAGFRPQEAGDDDPDNADGPWAVRSLKETETIARLANGVKRFDLPEDSNFIALLEQVAKGPNGTFTRQALETLAGLFENRQQYPRAAGLWKTAIDRFGPGQNNVRRKRLDQIVGLWGTFETATVAPAGTATSVEYRFRNGRQVTFEAYRVKVDTLLADVKSYLKSSPPRVDYRQINIGNIGHRLVYENQRKYVGERVARWTKDLAPRPVHLDRRITIITPLKEAGAYLLTARMGDGNTSRIILWISDTALLHKRINGGDLYFVADAVSGRPIARANVEFFGYVQKRIAKNRYQVEISQFAEFSDANGQVIPGARDVRKRFQWLVMARGPGNRRAYLGFQSAWYGRSRATVFDRSQVYVITDRPVYRPGQVAKFKFWIRNARFDKPETSVFAQRKVTIKITDPRNQSVLEKAYTTDAFGGFDGELKLPDDANLGNYSIRIVPKKSDLALGNGRRLGGGGGTFRVEEYKKPEFEVTVEAPQRPVELGEKITATIKARYYFGAPVTEAKVKYKVYRENYPDRWFPTGRWDWLYGKGYWWFGTDYKWYPGWHHWGCFAPFPHWYGQRQSAPELVIENEAEIGPDGTVTIEIDTALAKQLHGDTDHKYRITAEVVDRSRRTIVGGGSVLAARKAFKVVTWVDRGHYRTGQTIRTSIQARTLDGRPVVAKGKLVLYRVSYDEKGRPEEKQVRSWDVTTDELGHAAVTLKATDVGQYRLSCTLEDDDEHEIEGGYVFLVRGPDFDGNDFRFNDLELVADKREYEPGDTARLMINTNRRGGTVLVFVRPENGVYPRPQVIRLKGKSTEVEVLVKVADMPNFYVEAITIADGKIHSVSRQLVVPPVKRVVNVAIEPSEKEYLPGAPATLDLTLTDAQGEPFAGSLVLSMYDKSVEYISGGSNVAEIRQFFWNFRRYHYPRSTSNLQRSFGILLKRGEIGMGVLGTFGHLVADGLADRSVAEGATMKRSRSAVKSVAGAPMRQMALGQAAGFGGGARKAAGAVVPATVRKEFADTALWVASVTTDKQGKATVKLEMPENLTTWKVRAWAMGHGTSVGEETVEVITTKNVLVRLQAPRFFTETDEVVLSANVHNYLKKAKATLVRLELDGDTLVAVGPLEQRVNIPAGGEVRVDWKVRVVNPGEAVVRMAALTDVESDAMELKFPVHVHGMLKTESFTGVLRPDQKTAQLVLTVPADRRPAQTRLEIRYSPTLAGALVDALPYLVDFEYKCTEQTLNRFVPTVITQNLLQRMKIDLDDVRKKRTNLNAGEIGDDVERAKRWKRYKRNPVFNNDEVTRLVKDGVQALTEMQLSDGGWGWFSGRGERSGPHTTATVIHGLSLAKANDVALVPGVYEKGVAWLKRYQDTQVKKLSNAPTRTKPFKTRTSNIDALVYRVLVEAGTVSKTMEDYLYRDRVGLSVYAKGLLGLALHATGGRQRLAMVVRNIDQFLQQDEENQTAWLHLPNGSPWWHWYGSGIEANAIYLKLLALTEPKGIKASRLVKYLLNNRRHASYWNSTRDTSLCIEAMATYLERSGEAKPDVTIEVLIDGKSYKKVRVTSENLFSFDNALVLVGDDVSSGRHVVEFRRSGTGPVYFNAWLANFTTEEFITKAGLEIKVQRKYYRLVRRKNATTDAAGSRGQSLKQKVVRYDRHPIANLGRLTSGDLVEIELEIESKNDYEYLVFEDPKAAGFEPVDRQSGYTGGYPRVYRQLRDEKVCFFFRSLSRGRHSVSYRVRAEIPGRFSALPARGSAMYAPELKANSDEIKLLVADQAK